MPHIRVVEVHAFAQKTSRQFTQWLLGKHLTFY